MPYARWALAAAALASTGCFFDPGACTYEHRTLSLAGTVVTIGDGAAQTMSVTVDLNESTGDPGFRVLNIVLTTPLNGAIRSASLVELAPDGAHVLATWPSGNTILQSRWDSNLELGSSPPTHETLAQLAGSGHLQLRLEIDAASGFTAAAGLLHVVVDGGWMHPRCD